MKKISFLIVLLCAAISMQAAKVGFLVVGASDNADALPWEGGDWGWDDAQGKDINRFDASPERDAYNWFKNTYSAASKERILISTLQASSSKVPDDIDVLWVNLDRNDDHLDWSGDAKGYDVIFNDNVVAALSNFVKRGGNLLLTKQAARLASRIERANSYPTTCTMNKFQNQESSASVQELGASGYKVFNDCSFESFKYALLSSSYNVDRECVWEFASDEDRSSFEAANNAKVLGVDGREGGYGKSGFIEFYPQGDYKGTVLLMGLYGYLWCEDNTNSLKANVQKLTQNMLDYLSVKPSDASVNWQGWETAASGYIGASLAAATAPAAGDHIASISEASYSSSDANVASVNASTGAIDYNYFGSATITSTVTVDGDGQWVPKNAVAVSRDKSVTVSGGDASATIGYVLTAQQGWNRLSEEYTGIENPDLTAAKWFQANYVAAGTGQFINPANAIPDAVKVLWIHSDRLDLESGDYYSHLGGNEFRDKLANYINAGRNVFLSKQANRLIGDLSRNGYPTYGNERYESRDAWRIGNLWNLSGTEINHSDHAVYKNMGTSTTISAAGMHTNNNHVWQNFDENYNEYTPQRLIQYETDHNCRVLGGWGHADAVGVNDRLECVGFVEYYPQPATTQGTIIAMGLAAYQWSNPTENIKTLTSNILSYLSISEVPTFSWVVEPQNDMVGNTQRVQIEFKNTNLNWTSSNSSILDIEEDPEHTSDTDYKILRFKAPGEVTITATRSADGYNIPLNVTTPTTVTKTINIETNLYTRDVSAIPTYYGTICLPRAAASFEGATMFRLADKTAENGIIIEEVTEMAAGVPYIFLPTADEVRVTMTGNTADVQPANGLVGRLTALTLTADDNHYILAYNKIWQVDEAIEVPANRAYIDMSAINALSPAPGRKRYVIAGTNTATALEEMEMNDKPNAKVLRDGNLYIIKNGVQYNAQGQKIH